MFAKAPFLLALVLFAGSLSIQRVHALDLLAYFDFDDDSNPTVALDVSGNAPDAVLNAPAAFTADAGGVTGGAGDRALDLGALGNSAAAIVPAGSHFDAAANNNSMAVSFWQFNTQITGNSSAFWVHSPAAAANDARGFQAHTPWSDGTIFFDQSGCCAPSQRLTVGGLVTVNQWQHLVFQRDNKGNREIWIDGVLVASAGGAEDLDAFNGIMNIGAGHGNSNSFGGRIDEMAVFDYPLSPARIAELAEGAPVGSVDELDPLGLNVRRTEAGMLEISWNSKEGELYNLRSETGLSTEPLTWAIFDGNGNLAATPPRNTLTIPYPADPERFFAIEGFPKPPVVVFEDNFDGRTDLAPWTNSSPDGNPWELGVPTAALGPPSAFSPPNAVGTVLAGNYVASPTAGTFIVSSLRSPAISLSGIVSGTISYQRYLDMEDPQFDFATVNILNATDDSLIAELETGIGNGNLAWDGVVHDIPAAAIGLDVYFEIVFISDDFDSLQTGLVIDDFKVEGVEP